MTRTPAPPAARPRGDPAHAPATSTGRRLDQQRKADRFGLADDRIDLVRPVDRRGLERPGHGHDAHFVRGSPRMQLVAEGVDRRRRRSDEDDAGCFDGPGERRPLGQEAISRVDRLGAARGRGVEDRVDVQVALGGGRRSDPDRPIGQPDVLRRGVHVAVDGDRFHPQLVAGADDPDGDLAPVRDEDPPERGPGAGRLCAKTGPPQSGMLPCFFRGFVSRLSASSSSDRINRGRVSDGRMTSST